MPHRKMLTFDENGEPIDTTPKRPSAIQYFDEFRREQSI